MWRQCLVIIFLFTATVFFCEYAIHYVSYQKTVCRWPAKDPSMKKLPPPTRKTKLLPPRTLRTLIIADLDILGPHSWSIDRFRREWCMKRALQRALYQLHPDMVLVLGDISDNGSEATDDEWKAIVKRFRRITGRPSELPVHVVAGNHDVGDYGKLKADVVQRFGNKFAARNPSSSSIFEWGNLSFVSLNAMSLTGDGSPLCTETEKVVELASKTDKNKRLLANLPEYGSIKDEGGKASFEGSFEAAKDTLNKSVDAEPAGPVLLLHLPLYRVDESVCEKIDIPRCGPWHQVEGACLDINAASDLIVFSAHTHRSCSRMHPGGIQEVTVPSFSWKNRDDPAFLLAAFYPNGTIWMQQCPLPRESIVLGTYAIMGIFLGTWTMCLIVADWCCKRRAHSKQE
eukprot:jgi/Mesen1/2675/ME000167S01826